jgi:hypothetical protein
VRWFMPGLSHSTRLCTPRCRTCCRGRAVVSCSARTCSTAKTKGAAPVSNEATCIALIAAGSYQQKSHMRGMTYGALIVAAGVRGRSASPSIAAACASNITRAHVHSPDQTLPGNEVIFFTL